MRSVPSVSGAAGAPPRPGAPWQPPPAATAPDTVAPVTLPADLAPLLGRLQLSDVVDIALRNNPVTAISWAQARSAAATYGSARGAYLPTIDASATVSRTRSPGSRLNIPGERTQGGPSLNLSYLLFDLGGRSGTVNAARQAVFAAGFAHNATLQNVVLQVASSYFAYLATQQLAAAQRTTLDEATANLAAAEERNRVGLATIADVLQARTAQAQARLALQTTEGNIQATRGALAAAMGLPANVPYDIAPAADTLPVGMVTTSVDSLIAAAVRGRPDLAAARAQARSAAAQVSVARSRLLPALTLGASAGRTYSTVPAFEGNSYALTLGLQLPLFSGFSRRYDMLAAQADADAARASTSVLRAQVIQQVFTSYYSLSTATQRVRTANELLASAQQSEAVALGRYREGVGTILDLLAAQNALADARAQRVQARFLWSTALAQLARDVGVLGADGTSPFAVQPDSTIQPDSTR